jgi:hypothetical protein
MNVSLKRCAVAATFLERFCLTNIPKMRREVSRSGTDHTSVVDTYLLRPYDSCPIALGAFLVPHFGFPVVRHLYLQSAVRVSLQSAVRVSFGGLS